MRIHRQLAVAFFTATAAITHAQVQAEAPTQLHTPTLAPHHKHGQDLSWLWKYAQPVPDGRENALIGDPNFKLFLNVSLRAPQSFWNKGAPLPAVALEFLGVPGQVLAERNRYLTVTGCVPHFCPSRGLLWIDTGVPEPLVAFAAIDWIGDNRATNERDATYTLWLFPSHALSLARLPPALIESISRWTAQPSSGSTELQNVTRVYLVDPDGTPHPLSPTTVGAHNTLPAETSDELKVQP